MCKGRSFRVGAAICATGALLAGAASSLAAISGSYTGSGHAFTIAFDVRGAHVEDLSVACDRGATTVAALGLAPKVKHASFTYSGPARSTSKSGTIQMKVTGTFSDSGRKVNGKASTSGVCASGNYTASK